MILDDEKIKSTLRETSKDDDGNILIDDLQEVYNFDIVTEIIAGVYRNKKPLCSCDALFIKNKDEIFLIEFKNARKSRVPKKQLCEKAFDSIMTLQVAFFPNFSIEDLRKKVNLIFVYNNEGVAEKELESPYFDKIKSKFAQISNYNSTILFGLDKYKGIFYKNIMTVEKQIFLSKTYDLVFK